MDETTEAPARRGRDEAGRLSHELWLYEDAFAWATALSSFALGVAAPVALGLATCPAAGWALAAGIALAALLLSASLWLLAAGGER